MCGFFVEFRTKNKFFDKRNFKLSSSILSKFIQPLPPQPFTIQQENKASFCVDEIRLAKTMKIKGIKGNKLVGVHSGWTTKDIIQFKSGGDSDISRLRLSPKSKHKFNIEELFQARGLSKEEKYKIEPQDLH